MWSAKTHGNSETLGGAHGDISAPRARGLEQGQSQRIGRCDDKGSRRVRALREGLEVANGTQGVGNLEKNGENALVRREGEGVGHKHL